MPSGPAGDPDPAVVHFRMEPGCEDLVPRQAHPDDAGYDLRSSQEVVLSPLASAMVHTGVHVLMHRPEVPGVRLQMLADVRSRSGLACRHGIFVLNSPGTIDQSYTGEICVVLFNTGNEPYAVRRGDRVAQLVFLYQPAVELRNTPTAEFATMAAAAQRGEAGFGSTGV